MKNQTASNASHTLGLLGIVFITLKLIGTITWSWWWVLAPFWGGFALFVAVLLLIFGGMGLVILGATCLEPIGRWLARRRVAKHLKERMSK